MLLVTLNAAFGAGFLLFAMNAGRRGWPFAKHGWLLIQAQTAHPDYRENVERRRSISEGGRFLIAGVLWLGASLGSALAGVYFSVQALTMMYGGS
jgi:hypothetical protein